MKTLGFFIIQSLIIFLLCGRSKLFEGQSIKIQSQEIIQKELIVNNSTMIIKSGVDIIYYLNPKTFIEPFNPYTDYDKPVKKHFYQWLKLQNNTKARLQDFVAALNNIGHSYSSKGKHVSAMKFYQMAFKKGFNYIQGHAQGLQNIGTSYYNQGKYRKALQHFIKALKIRQQYQKILQDNYGIFKVKKQAIDQNNCSIATLLHKIGKIFLKQKKIDQALNFLIKSYNIRKFILKNNHSDIAESFLSIGNTYNRKGMYDGALQYLSKSIQIIKSQYGQNSPILGQILNRIGRVYANKGDLNKSLQYTFKAQKIILTCLGKNHEDYAISMNCLGYIYDLKQQYQLSQKYFQESIRILQNQQYVYQLQLALRFINLGWNSIVQKKYQKAFYYLFKGKIILDKNQDKITFTFIYSKLFQNLGILYANWGKYNQSLLYQQQSLKLKLKLFEEFHPERALTLMIMGSIYFQQKYYLHATTFYFKVKQIYENFKMQNHPYYKDLMDYIKLNEIEYWQHSKHNFINYQFKESFISIFKFAQQQQRHSNTNNNKKQLVSVNEAIQRKIKQMSKSKQEESEEF